MSEYQTIRYHRRGYVGTLTLARPGDFREARQAMAEGRTPHWQGR